MIRRTPASLDVSYQWVGTLHERPFSFLVYKRISPPFFHVSEENYRTIRCRSKFNICIEIFRGIYQRCLRALNDFTRNPRCVSGVIENKSFKNACKYFNCYDTSIRNQGLNLLAMRMMKFVTKHIDYIGINVISDFWEATIWWP